MNRGKVAIILPSLNEQQNVGKVLDELPQQALTDAGYDVQVVVADGGSSDHTRQIAEQKGAEVIIEPRKGKGKAVRAAFERINADFLFMLDADYTYPAGYIVEMLPLLEQGSPVVIGSRLQGKRELGAMTRLNFIGNHLLTLMANILYRNRTSDLCTGFWGFRGEVLRDLKLSADGFCLEADLFIQLSRKGYRIADVPITYRRRATKQKLHPFRDGLKIGWKLLKDRF